MRLLRPTPFIIFARLARACTLQPAFIDHGLSLKLLRKYAGRPLDGIMGGGSINGVL